MECYNLAQRGPKLVAGRGIFVVQPGWVLIPPRRDVADRKAVLKSKSQQFDAFHGPFALGCRGLGLDSSGFGKQRTCPRAIKNNRQMSVGRRVVRGKLLSRTASCFMSQRDVAQHAMEKGAEAGGCNGIELVENPAVFETLDKHILHGVVAANCVPDRSV